jgi:hypothetical protein
MLACADTVRLLGIDYSPVGRHVTEKWQRVALGKELRTIVVQDVDLVKGKRISTSVNELRYEFAAPLNGDHRTFHSKNVWDEFQPAAPVPIIKSVSVGFSYRRPWYDEGAGTSDVFSEFAELPVSHRRGDSFFRAFPNATKVKFKERLHNRFFDQPESMMSNVRKLTMFFNGSDGRTQPDVVFPFLHRFKNLTVLELLGCSAGIQLNSLPQNYRQLGLLCTPPNFAQSSKLFRKKIFFGTKVTSEAF